MKKILTVITMIAILALSTVAGSAAKPICVYPTGNYPDDFLELDRAINGGTGPSGTVYPGGGTLRLKATDQNGQFTPFNLGDGPNFWDRGSIQVLVKDLKLLGETVNGNMTTVYGGFSTFHTIAQVNITIDGICFDGALMVPFAITNSTDATIRGNKIMNLRAYGPELPGGPPWAQSYGIFVNTEAPPFVGEITGKVVIEDNEIILSILESDLEYNVKGVPIYKGGVAVLNTNAVVFISSNTMIGDFTDAGVHAWENKKNIIKKNFIRADFPNLTLDEIGNGIVARDRQEPAGIYYIDYNKVVCENPEADGIFLIGQELRNSMVSKNEVIMYDGDGAISLSSGASDNTITQNKIRGSADYGFRLKDGAHHNTFYLGDDDNLEGLQAVAHIYCGPDTFDNGFIGEDLEDLIIEDQGINNKFLVADDDGDDDDDDDDD